MKIPRPANTIASFSILAVLALALVFAASAKQAEVTDYSALTGMPESSLATDRSIIYSWSLATPILSEELAELPKNFLAMPIKNGRVSASLNNSVIIPASCDTPVLASADGMVAEIGNPAEWNGGLGGYIKIKHLGKNFETIYSHLRASNIEEAIQEGSLVKKGQIIARVGQSGESKAGCNLQFGVLGAINPFLN